MDLGTHAQIYEAAKELHTMKFNTVESTISAFNTFYSTITDAGLTTVHELLPYMFLAVLTPHFGLAIHHMLTDTPQALQTIPWTLEAVGRYFLWKRPSRQTFQQREKGPPTINAANFFNTATNTPTIVGERQEGITYTSASKCVTCGRH